MNCTHVPHDHLKVGDLCSICNTKIVSFVAEPARLATRGGEGAEASPTTPVAHPSFPAAHIAANPVSPTARAAAAAPETIPSPVVSGAPIARNTDPQAAHDAAARAAHDYTFDQWLVLAAHVASRDLNGDELGAVCGRPYQSVGPRRPALERNGLIEETGTRRKGKGCYRATDAGRAAWRDCPASIRPTVLAQLTNTAVMALRGAA